MISTKSKAIGLARKYLCHMVNDIEYTSKRAERMLDLLIEEEPIEVKVIAFSRLVEALSVIRRTGITDYMDRENTPESNPLWGFNHSKKDVSEALNMSDDEINQCDEVLEQVRKHLVNCPSSKVLHNLTEVTFELISNDSIPIKLKAMVMIIVMDNFRYINVGR